MSPTTLLATDSVMEQRSISPATLEALHDALFSERRLLDDLIGQMRRQRTAVARDDIDGVDESTFATHRILATLGQARQRRRQLNVLLGGSEECTLQEIEELLGDRADERLRDARARLQQAADTLTREVGMNRRLLREALNGTQAHVRTLTGGQSTMATYGSEGTVASSNGTNHGILVNRMV